VLFALSPDGILDPAAAQDVQLRIFDCPATESIRLRQLTGRLSYRYSFAGHFDNISPVEIWGANHAAEVPVIFGTYGIARGSGTALEKATSHAMQDAWVAFAGDPVHGPKRQGWKPYTQLGRKQVREFGKGVAAQDISLAAQEALCDGAEPL